MIKSYFKIILRSLSRNKTFSFINLLGLSIGLASFMLIGLYVMDEYSYDRFHEKTGRIYQLSIVAAYDGQVRKWIGVPNKSAPAFAREIPEVERAVRILPNNFDGKAFVSSEQIKSSENRLVWADAGLFEVFTIPFLRGDPATALARPHTVVLSEASAIKYFGSTDVIGKSLRIDRDTADFEVTGVYSNPPGNTRFQYPIIGSFAGTWFDQPNNQSWGNASFETYLLLHDNAEAAAVEKKIENILTREIATDDRWFSLAMHPLKNIHLYYGDVQESSGAIKGDINQLLILVGLGILILIIAAVNYMNLSTAQSQRRFKEVGINKTLGATRTQLAGKFYLETSVFVLVAVLISMLFVLTSLPVFSAITGKHFGDSFLSNNWFWASSVVIWVLLSLMAGIYPALYLSSFSPREVLKGSMSGQGGNATLRKALVVVQFSVSIILIISTLVLYQQIGFIREKKLGYEPEQVVAVSITGASNREQVQSLASALKGLAPVTSVARSQSYPGSGGSGRTLPSLDRQANTPMTTVRATPEVLQVLGIKLLAGKALPEKMAGDTTIQVVVNKRAVDFLGLSPEEAIGKKSGIFDEGGDEIVGVTEDFHFQSLHQPIGAYCFHNAATEPYHVLLVKVQTRNLTETIAAIEQEFKKIIPTAFEYTFLDQQLQTLYQAEQQMAQVILLFSILAIFIACLGLYALAAFTTEQRTKEIGIRKVMGASVLQLSTMLSRDFIKLVLISFVIAMPIGYYVMNQWLEGFAFRIEIKALVFIVAGLLSMGIAWFTVGFESVKAAVGNPVVSLRSE